MPGTEINISLGIQTLTFDDTGAVMPKILNLVQGDNITFEYSVDPLDPTKVNVTINSTGGGSGDTHLILESIRDFDTNPLTDGNSFTVATTMAVGKQLKDFYMRTTGIVTTPNDPDIPVQISIGIQTDSPEFFTTDPTYGDSTAGFNSQISVTNPTTAINRNLVITAIGGSITGGNIDKIIAEYLK